MEALSTGQDMSYIGHDETALFKIVTKHRELKDLISL